MTDTLLITIGESWTWGDSLDEHGHERLKNVYGYHLSDMLNADWQNIAFCGASNGWMAQQYNNFVNKNYDYKNVIIICTLTEVGREFNAPDLDNNRDYISDLETARTFKDVQNLQSRWLETQFQPTTYTTLFGTNFVDSNYSNLNVLDKSWIEVIGDHIGVKPPREVYTVGSWVFEKLSQATEFKKFDREVWLKSTMQEMDKARQVTRWLDQSPLNYERASKHPTPEGHRLWAEYLYKHIGNN